MYQLSNKITNSLDKLKMRRLNLHGTVRFAHSLEAMSTHGQYNGWVGSTSSMVFGVMHYCKQSKLDA